MNYKSKKILKKNREEILLTMPSFINQLLLLLNSGMVLQDAFSRVAIGYGELDKNRQNYFTRQVNDIYVSSSQTGENVITSFYRFSRFSNVKELTRVANILLENQSKGTDLWDKLAEEGESMWKERKRLALEKIRVTESKMSFPLGILLLSLIIITAAPAMLQI